MKKMIFTGVLVFSLVLNVAVLATLAWYGWFQRAAFPVQGSQRPVFTSTDLREIRSNWPGNGLGSMRENQERILEKKREILDLIAQNPGNPQAAEKQLADLISLRAQQEREAVARISNMAATMPEQQRNSFLQVIRNRTCMGPGMGYGMGGGRGHGMGMGMGMGRHMRGRGSGSRWMQDQ